MEIHLKVTDTEVEMRNSQKHSFKCGFPAKFTSIHKNVLQLRRNVQSHL